MKDFEAEFRKYYTVSLRNYPVQDAYLQAQKVHAAGGAAP
jgi:formylmethanofuran dehydrogenase subunit A